MKQKITRKDNAKPGEVVLVDQLVMSQSGIIPQVVDKLTNRRLVGSQADADHNNSTKHVEHLKEFTID